MSFITSEDRDNLRAIERLIRTPLQPAADIPGYTAPTVGLMETFGHRPSPSRGGGHQASARQRVATKSGARRRFRRGKRGTRIASAKG